VAEVVFDLVRNNSATLAACLMPDHLHWLVLPEEGSPSSFVARFKSFSTHAARRTGHKGRLWQRSFYDHVVRRNEGCREIARYILANPVRAGLVNDWRGYQHAILFEERFPF
jgi:REP element-mobilizing transposase RayT